MDAGKLQRHPFGDHPLFAAGVDEQQVFLPVFEEPKIATGIALLRRHFKPARRRHPARRRRRDIGLDAVQRVDGDALALAQPVHQLAVIDRTTAKGRFRHVCLAAEFRNLAEDLVVFHRAKIGGREWQKGGKGRWAAADQGRRPSTICPPRECGRLLGGRRALRA